MIINYRYYVITIISIFLALGIGVVIGFLMDGDQLFINQQEAVISQLENKFNELSEERTTLQTSLEQYLKDNLMYDEFSKIAYEEMIKERLTDSKVAIIQTTDEFIFSSLNKTLTDSGADITSVTYIKKDFLQSLEDKSSPFFSQLNEIVEMSEENTYEVISAELAKSVALANNKDFMDILISNGFVEVYGELTTEVDYVVVVGGSSENSVDRINKIDIPIIRSVKQMGVPILGVERSDIKHSYMKYYKAEQISTVDNIDTTIGQISAIMVMWGKPGNYGVKKEAEAFMPDGFTR